MVPVQIADSHQRERQPATCVVSYTFWPSAEKVLRWIMGAFASEFGRMDTVLLFVVEVYISSASYYNKGDSPAH